VVTITREQNIICSKTLLKGFTFARTISVGSYLQAMWWLLANEKWEKALRMISDIIKSNQIKSNQ